jgi:hypothetical protein
MNNISEIILQLPSLIGVSLDSMNNCPKLYTIRDIMYHLQMGYYWLKEANTEYRLLDRSTLITANEDEEHELIIPTILGTQEQLGYLKDNLTKLGQETWEYCDNAVLPLPVKYKVEQAYNNIMLALFNTELSTTYYEQISGIRYERPITRTGDE